MRRLRTIWAGLAILGLAGACTETEPTLGRFEISGEVIALSGGDAGARGACITCHGLEGGGNGHLAPRLAGLNQGYFVRQMDYFAQGHRRHPQMTWIADHIDWPARQKLANYYAELPIPEGAASVPSEADCAAATLYHYGDPDRGLPSCASCHGDDGAGIGQGYPSLAAQPAPYLEAQLNAWANGERYGSPGNVKIAISRLLTPAEMERLAGYSSALPGASGYPAPPATCPRTRRPDPRNGA